MIVPVLSAQSTSIVAASLGRAQARDEDSFLGQFLRPDSHADREHHGQSHGNSAHQEDKEQGHDIEKRHTADDGHDDDDAKQCSDDDE